MSQELLTGGVIEDIMPEPQTMDPIASQEVLSGSIQHQLFDGLTCHPDGELEVELLLADSVETNDDYTEYTFTLKEGVRYHDGREVTAADFVYAWERVVASEHSETAQHALDVLNVAHETDEDGDYVPWSLGVEAVDDYTLRLELSKPFHATLSLLASPCFVPIPEGLVGDVEGVEGEMSYEEFATSNPIGCGPFSFDEWVDGEDVRISRFDDYHGHAPYAEGVHWKLIQRAEERYQYSLEKQTDRIFLTTAVYDEEKIHIDFTDSENHEVGAYGPMENGEVVDYHRTNELSTFYFAFNTAVVPKPVRQAFAWAMDQHHLAQVIFKNRSEPAYHITPPAVFPGGREAYWERVENEYPYGVGESRPEEARAVMEEAGYSADDPYEITFTAYELESWVDVAEVIADWVSDAHVDVTIEEMSPTELIEAGRRGELELYTLGRLGLWPSPESHLQMAFPENTDTSDGESVSYVNWLDSEASDRAAAAADTILSHPEPTEAAREKREAAALEIEQANWEDVVFICSFHNRSERLTYPNLHIRPYGPMGRWRQKMNYAWKE